MGKANIILLLILISCTVSTPSNAQIGEVTFKDSIYVATYTHYFIPLKINNNDTSIIHGEEEIQSIEWTENGRIMDPDSVERAGGSIAYRHRFSEEGTYQIGMELTDSLNLTHYVSKTIFVNNAIEVPNVFSPDDDGINDVFIVKSSGDHKIRLEIYTRNGELICEKIGPVVYWDGRLASGNYAKQGVYYYIVQTQNPPEVIKKGFFHLYR